MSVHQVHIPFTLADAADLRRGLRVYLALRTATPTDPPRSTPEPFTLLVTILTAHDTTEPRWLPDHIDAIRIPAHLLAPKGARP